MRLSLRLVCIMIAALTAVPALASVNVHTLAPAASPHFVYSEDTGAADAGRGYFGAFYTFVDTPLVELNSDRTARRSTLVDSFNSLDLSAAYAVLDRLQLGASIGVTMAGLPDGSRQTGLGDTRAFAKLRLNDMSAPVWLALMPIVWAPTGDSKLYLSDGQPAGGMLLVAETSVSNVRLSANAGYRYAPGAQFRDLDLRQTLPLSLSALVPVGGGWSLNADASAQLSLPLNSYQNPSAFYAGARYLVTPELTAVAGAALGAFNSTSSAGYRVVAGLSFTPVPADTPVVMRFPERGPVVSATDKSYSLVIGDDIKFGHDQFRLTAQGKVLLDHIAELLLDKQDGLERIIIEGHANELGSFPYNQKLSERRAREVKYYLIGKGLRPKLLSAVGYGKTRPKAPRTAPRRVRLVTDRRVEFKVISPTAPPKRPVLTKAAVKLKATVKVSEKALATESASVSR